MAPRITIVGGGSSHWTPKLLVDFANTPSLCGADVTLMDIDEHSLPRMIDVAKRIVAQRRIDLAVRTTTDLDEAVDGAEFVVTALSVGGFASMRHDIEIPARYGLRQPVGDSVGPGGIARALRSVPVMVDIATAVERRSPDALVLNVSNPLTALCRAVGRETGVRVVGLCNEVVGLQFAMSLLFDADMRSVDPVVAGVNHLPLVTSMTIGGEDGFAMLRDLLADPSSVADDPVWLNPLPPAMHYPKVSPRPEWTKADVLAGNRVKLELFSRFGVLPGSSDTHVAEFFSGFVTAASDFGRDWAVHHYGIAGHMADKAEDEASLEALLGADDIPRWPSGELVANVLDGIVTGAGHALPVNLPNAGQVASLPDGVVVECMGIPGAGGVGVWDSAAVPGALGELLRRVSASQELTVSAALSGSPVAVLEAMLTDAMAGALPYEHVVSMTDELLAATKDWLPQFRV